MDIFEADNKLHECVECYKYQSVSDGYKEKVKLCDFCYDYEKSKDNLRNKIFNNSYTKPDFPYMAGDPYW